VGSDGSIEVRHAYDALGRRVSRTQGSATTVFVQSGQQTIADYVAGALPSASTYRYVYASYIDEPVMRWQTSNSARVYYHRNQQYSVTALTSNTGAVLERYAYTAYGVPTITTATGTLRSVSAHANRYMYTGREWDPTIFQYHYRARMYDANLGRFCSRDPIGYEGSEWNVYEYTESSPLAKTDPKGKESICSGYAPAGPCLVQTIWWIPLRPCRAPTFIPLPDNYPHHAKKCCEGFLSLYGDEKYPGEWEPSDAVSCVADCLVDAERGCASITGCDDRQRCRSLAHVDCYGRCGFVPYKGMPWACLAIADEVLNL